MLSWLSQRLQLCTAEHAALLLVDDTAVRTLLSAAPQVQDGCTGFSITCLSSGIALPLDNIALMKVMVGLHLMNTRVGIYLLYAAIGLPLSIFIAHGFMSGIPRELDEAAVIDGCNACNLFLNVIVPLLKPVASTLFILNFLNTWNDFTMAIYFLNGSDKMPVTLSVYNFFGQFQKSWNLVCADIMLTAFPVLIVYLFAQKYIIQGLTSGAVKG